MASRLFALPEIPSCATANIPTDPSRLNEITTMATSGSANDIPRSERTRVSLITASPHPDDARQTDRHHPLVAAPAFQGQRRRRRTRAARPERQQPPPPPPNH